MTINVPPVAVSSSSAAHLRDGNKSASVPDFFRLCAHDLYPIGALYRVAGDQFNRALNACERGRTADLYSALINVRANAMRLAELTKELERKIDGCRADEIDDCKTVYAP